MKSYVLFFVTLSVGSFSFGQNLMELATRGRSKLVYEKPFEFKLDNSDRGFKNRISSLREQKLVLNNPDILIDSLKMVELSKKTENQNLSKWLKEELPNVYLMSDKQKLNVRTVLTELGLSEENDIKELKKQVRNFNYDPQEWRVFPISVSRPIYSDDRMFALIAFNFGNSGGKVNLYKSLEDGWVYAGELGRWSY